MHYAEFAENEVVPVPPLALPTHARQHTERLIPFSTEFAHAQTDSLTTPTQSQMLLNAIKEYEANKWKVIGQKVGKPAKVCLILHRVLHAGFFDFNFSESSKMSLLQGSVKPIYIQVSQNVLLASLTSNIGLRTIRQRTLPRQSPMTEILY